MSSTDSPTLRSMIWDPKSPYTLMLPRFSDGEAMDTLSALAGVGCNDYERSALMRILQVHEEYQEGDKSPSDIKTLSQQYRQVVLDCLAQWDEEDSSIRPSISDTEMINLELLKAMYAVMDLSGVFMPLLMRTRVDMNFYDDPFEKPGAATADVVRYLRYNHMGFARDMDPDIEDMLESEKPEEYRDGKLYWNYITTLVLRGCLEEAWDALGRHSLFRASLHVESMTDPYAVQTMTTVQEDFLALKELLMRAPLPGGRTDEYDDGTFSSRLEELEDTEYVLDGLDVKPSDYLLWEYELSNESVGGGYTFVYDADVATAKHQEWQEYVGGCLGSSSSFTLKDRIPELKPILEILSGDRQVIKNENLTWAERLCAELLYVQPSIKPSHLSDRASSIMGTDNSSDRNEVILSIMGGDFGRAVQVMYLLGASSGAALPSTLTSLLYNMFIDADLTTSDFKVKLLCEASSAILSSLAQSSPDVGVRLSIQLLTPYATEEDISIPVSAVIANTLEHHCPESDASANSLLSLCRPLVERKSARVLDGCASIILCRYRYYVKTRRPAGAINWLLVGVEMESLVLQAAPETGSCYRTLVGVCQTTSCQLLSCLNEKSDVDKSIYSVAQQMVAGLQDKDVAFDMESISPAKELVTVLSLFDVMISEEAGYGHAASLIVTLLEERKDRRTGVVCCLAAVTTYWPLLRLARIILDHENKKNAEASKSTVFTAAFDKRGITVLMEKLTYVLAFASEQSNSAVTPQEISGMREALALGLARAFVADNAKKKYRAGPSRKNEEIDGIMTVDLGKYSLSTQEKVVQSMLDY